jgi:hypothetical protein
LGRIVEGAVERRREKGRGRGRKGMKESWGLGALGKREREFSV